MFEETLSFTNSRDSDTLSAQEESSGKNDGKNDGGEEGKNDGKEEGKGDGKKKKNQKGSSITSKNELENENNGNNESNEIIMIIDNILDIGDINADIDIENFSSENYSTGNNSLKDINPNSECSSEYSSEIGRAHV